MTRSSSLTLLEISHKGVYSTLPKNLLATALITSSLLQSIVLLYGRPTQTANISESVKSLMRTGIRDSFFFFLLWQWMFSISIFHHTLSSLHVSSSYMATMGNRGNLLVTKAITKILLVQEFHVMTNSNHLPTCNGLGIFLSQPEVAKESPIDR